MKIARFKKIGRNNTWAAWWKHMRKEGKRQSNKTVRKTFNKRKITAKDW